MEKRNLLFIPFILGIGIGVFSCNMGDSGNSSTFNDTPAVVGWDMYMGGTTIGIPGGYLAAPSLIDVEEGTCLLLRQFTIDYNNQPTDKYFTATNIVKEIVEKSYLEYSRSADELETYTLPLSTVSGMGDIYFRGKIFVAMKCRDNHPVFRLIYNPEEEQINGVKSLYLQAEPSSSTETSSDVSAIHAFDILHFIQIYGRDTTITYSGSTEKVDLKYIKTNLKYVSKVTDGIPEYSTVNDSDKPFEIAIFTNY